MSIKSKNEDYYIYLLKMVDHEMINVDYHNFENEEKVEKYVNTLKESFVKDLDRDRKINNMIRNFLKGYDYKMTVKRKVVSGMDKEYSAMSDFLSPYVFRQKHSASFSNVVRQGVVKIHQTFAYEVGFLIYDRICIKIPKKQAHLMKIKDKTLHTVLSEDLSNESIIRYIMGKY